MVVIFSSDTSVHKAVALSSVINPRSTTLSTLSPTVEALRMVTMQLRVYNLSKKCTTSIVLLDTILHLL